MIEYKLPELKTMDSEYLKTFLYAKKHLLDNPAILEGKELNSVTKNWEDDFKLRFVVAIPTEYSAGVNNMGLNVLYSTLNDDPEIICERSFLPEKKLINILEKEKLPIGFSLENKRCLTDFDIIGFSSYFELQFIPMVKMMHASGIPVYAEERTEKHPLVILGGMSSYSASPVDQLLDMIFIGDGEVQFPFFKDKVYEYKQGKLSKDELLLWFSQNVPGCYVPKFYDYNYNEGEENALLSIKSIEPKPEYVGKVQYPVTKALLDLTTSTPFYRSVLPAVDGNFIGYNSVELARGCHSSCRFCMAGAIGKPYREHSVEKVIDTMKKAVDTLGSKAFTPYSLNYSAYSQKAELAFRLKGELRKGATTASQRADSFCPVVADALAKSGTRNATFAIEAGSQRMRDVINKEVKEEDFLNALFSVIDSGYRAVKIYMISNLPWEQEEDRLAIIDVLRKVDNYRRYIGELSKQVDSLQITKHDASKLLKNYRRQILGEYHLREMSKFYKELITYTNDKYNTMSLEDLKKVTVLKQQPDEKDYFVEYLARNFETVDLKELSQSVKDFEAFIEGLINKINGKEITIDEAFEIADEEVLKYLKGCTQEFILLNKSPDFDIARRGSTIELRVSYTEFTAKPFTALQWADVSDWSNKLEEVYKLLSEVNVKYRRSISGINHFMLQLLNRVNRSFNDVIVDLVVNEGMMYNEAVYIRGKDDDEVEEIVNRKCIKYTGYPMIDYLKEIPLQAVLPWDIFSVGFDPNFMRNEYRKAMKAVTTPSCYTMCTKCGVCTDEELVKMGATYPVYHRLQHDLPKDILVESALTNEKEPTFNKIVVKLYIPPTQRDHPPSKFKIALKAAFSGAGIDVKDKVEMLSETVQWDNWVFGLDYATLRTSKPIAALTKKETNFINSRLKGLIEVQQTWVYDNNVIKGLHSLGEKLVYHGKLHLPKGFDLSKLNFENKMVSFRQKERNTDMRNRVAYVDREKEVTIKTVRIGDTDFYNVFLLTDIETNVYDVLRTILQLKNKRDLLKFPFERLYYFNKPKSLGVLSTKCGCGAIKEVDIFNKPIGKKCLSCMMEEGSLVKTLRKLEEAQ